MVNITPILIGLLTIFGGVMTCFAIPWFKETRSEIKDERIRAAVDSACKWAEQTLTDFTGPQKRRKVLDYMQTWLNERGYKYDEEELSIYLESSVFDIFGGFEYPVKVSVVEAEDDGK